jgi:hypothetical protein
MPRISVGKEETAVISSSARSCDGVTPSEKADALTRVQFLEHETFGDGGHLRSGVDPDAAERTLAQINELRHLLGWLEIDLNGRWRWPVSELTPAAA